MDCSTPDFPVLHYLLEFAQTRVHWVSDASNHLILCHHFRLLPSAFPPSASFPVSRLYTSGGQRIGTSSSASVLPVNIQAWFSLGLTGLISLQSKKLLRVCSSTTIQKHQFFRVQPSLWSSSHIFIWLIWPLKNHIFDYMNLWWQSDVSAVEYALWVSHSFSSKEQVSFNFMAAVTVHSDFGAQENKICPCFHFFPIYLPWMMGADAMILVFWMLSFKPLFHSTLSPCSRGSLVPLSFQP